MKNSVNLGKSHYLLQIVKFFQTEQPTLILAFVKSKIQIYGQIKLEISIVNIFKI